MHRMLLGPGVKRHLDPLLLPKMRRPEATLLQPVKLSEDRAPMRPAVVVFRSRTASRLSISLAC
ncbi:hypothetical protein SFUMM280S_06521 [Streptomyces fumanus]